jgi:uncharacterized protein YfaS (alpha-2-macroglobulin family)
MRLYVMGLVALLALCSSVSGYFYMYGETQFLPGETPKIEVSSWDGEDVALSVFKLDIDLVYEFLTNPQDEGVLEQAMSSGPVYQTVVKADNDGWGNYVEIPVTEKGWYVVLGRSKDENRTTAFIISRLGLLTKRWEGNLLVYGLDISNGQPLEGVSLNVYDHEKFLFGGKTDEDGIFVRDIIGENLNIVGQIGDDTAVLSPYFYGGSSESAKVYVYTDRPVYRPNQDVYLKAVVWKQTKDGFEIPTGEARVEIQDAKGNTVYDENITMSEFGSVSGKFSLGDEPPLGYYSIYIYVKGLDTGYGSFEVQEYKKPEYQVTLKAREDKYIRGDEVIVDLEASYYFGSPVPDADVEYTLRKSSWYYPCRGYKCYYIEDSYYYGYGEVVKTGSGVTNGEGKLEISFTPDNEYNSVYSIEARVIDKSRREVTGAASVVVAKGEFDFEIETDRYSYTVGETAHITVRSKDIEGVPVSVFGKLTVVRRTWDKEYKDVTVFEEEVETDEKGEATLEFVPDEAGEFYIKISGEDSHGNEIESEHYLYVMDEEPRWDYWEQLGIMLDKETYEVGDTAKITINSPTPDFTALITLEGEGVYGYYVRTFEGTSGTLDVQVKEEYEPNVAIYAMVVKNKTQYSDSVDLIVPPADKFLDIEIIPNGEEYMPRDEGTFKVVTKDSNGKPISAELSLGIVDESIYAIVEEQAMEIEKFFYGRRWSNVMTQASWQYGGPILRDMAETAQMVAPGAPMPMGEAVDMEGGFSAKAAAGLVAPQIRKYFPDTAFWHAHILTDEKGEATIRLTMPDSLTTWRATARGVDREFQVGQNTNTVITRKNLIVRLETPRFFTQKDELLISAVVHNYLGKMKDIVVELKADGVELLDDAKRTVSVAHGGDERVDWRIRVNSCCEANFTVKALTDEESDAMEMVIPIIPHGIEEQEVWAGSVEDSVTKSVLVPEGSIYGATELSLMVSPSIASTAFDALEYLASYPYGCVEQTMSAFLPDVYVAQVLRDLDIEKKELEEKLPEMVSEGLQKLYNMQHGDGGWGWWENDDTHPYMTAYVVYGLTQAKRAGFTVDNDVLQNGLSSLRKQYSESKLDANTKAYMAYSLSFYGKPEGYPDDADLSDYGLALKTLARLNTGDASGFPNKLGEHAVCDEIMCHWSSETYKYDWRNNDVETTAYVLMAMLKSDPDNEMVEKMIRWLVSNRRGKQWYSTKDTAIAVFALAEYLKISKELSPNYVAKVYLNGDLAESVKKDDAFSMDNEIKLDPATGLNEIRIVKEGEGKLYYSLFLKYFKEEEDIKAKSSGIGVSREYNVTSARSGEYIQVKLTIDAPADLEYIILEDPIPAGCEVVEDVRASPYYWDYGWGYWYSQREVRDEKVVYFMTYVSPGKNEIAYTLRAEVPGAYHVMPATAWNMYDEKIRGHSAETRLEIADKLRVRITDISIDGDSVDFRVDALKMVEEDLSGEVLVQVRDLKGNVLGEKREYISLKESENRQDVSIPVSLEDGLYTLSYRLETADGDVVMGSTRIQVGEVETTKVVTQGPVPTSEIEKSEGGDDAGILLMFLAIVVVAIGLIIMRRKKR